MLHAIALSIYMYPAYFQWRHLMRPTKSKPAGWALSQLASQSRTLAGFDYSNVLDNYLYIQALMQTVRKLSFVLWQTHEEWWGVWLPCCSIYPEHCQLTWHCASLLNLICFTKLIMCTSVASHCKKRCYYCLRYFPTFSLQYHSAISALDQVLHMPLNTHLGILIQYL